MRGLPCKKDSGSEQKLGALIVESRNSMYRKQSPHTYIQIVVLASGMFGFGWRDVRNIFMRVCNDVCK